MEEFYRAYELYEHFWCIEDGHVRMFLIEGEDTALLVDTGNGTADLKKFIETLTSKSLELVITHCHPDHVGATQYFKKAYIHTDEIEVYHSAPYGNREIALTPVEEGFVFNIGGYQFEVIHVPGHTPGSIVLFDRKKGIMLSGDTVQVGPIFMIDKLASSFKSFEESMEKLQRIQKDIDIIYPSHYAMPIDISYIEELKIAAKKMLAGELEGKEASMGQIKANIYRYKRVAFLA